MGELRWAAQGWDHTSPTRELGKAGAGPALSHFPSVVMAEAALSENKLSWFVDLNLRIYVEAVEKSGA